MSQIAFEYSLNYTNSTSHFLLWVQAFCKIALRPRFPDESNKPQYVQECKITIDKYSIEGRADDRRLGIFDIADKHDLIYGRSSTSSSASLWPVGRPERVLLVRPNTPRSWRKFLVETFLDNTRCSSEDMCTISDKLRYIAGAIFSSPYVPQTNTGKPFKCRFGTNSGGVEASDL